MNLITLMRKIAPYVRPYKWLVVATLALTLIGSLIAQVNAVVLGRTVIIISQIIESDMIYALRDGRVEQFGNPDELYQKGGVYKDIVDASARNLNIDKLAHTLDRNGDGQLFD